MILKMHSSYLPQERVEPAPDPWDLAKEYAQKQAPLPKPISIERIVGTGLAVFAGLLVWHMAFTPSWVSSEWIFPRILLVSAGCMVAVWGFEFFRERREYAKHSAIFNAELERLQSQYRK